MKNTIHTDINHPVTYEGGVNGDISPNKQYQVGNTAYRLINTRINPLSQQIEGIEGVDLSRPVTVVRDGVKPVSLSPTLVKWANLGDDKVLLFGGSSLANAQIALYSGGTLTVLAQSSLLGVKAGYKVDMATDGKNEVYICGDKTPNLFLSIKDMQANVANETYFTEFDLNKHILRVDASIGVPIYVGHETVGAALGLKAGSYCYFIRLVDADGNRTSWSQATPLIPVTYQVGPRTVGAPVNAATSWGIRIRFRVDGSAGFSYVEIGRMAYNTGQPVGFLPNLEVTKLVNDAYGTNVVLSSVGQIIDYVDTSSAQYITEADSASYTPSQMENCNNLTYYDGRIVYSGIKYKQLDLSPSIKLLPTSSSTLYPASTPDTYMYPFTLGMGVEGHSNLNHQVYHKSEMPGEYRNYAIVLWDGKGGRTPAIPLSDLKAYRIPNLREPLIAESEFMSKDAEDVVRVDGTNGKTLNYFQCADGDELPEPDRDIVWSTLKGKYSPLHPVKSTDPLQDAFRFSVQGDGHPYRMPVKNKTWRTIGNKLQGIDTSILPDWVKAFSIVASDSIGAVALSGVVSPDWVSMFNPLGGSKPSNKVAFYSADMEVLLNIADKIQSNPSSYTLQLQAPLSFIPDMAYSTNKANSSDLGRCTDMMLHVVGNNAYGSSSSDLSFGVWKNPTSTITYNGDSKNCFEYVIISATIVSGSLPGFISAKAGTSYLVITLNGDVYNGVASGVRFYEPWYLASIKTSGDFTRINSNITTYKPIGNYQKLSSDIGVASGSAQEFVLVDERPEDCISDHIRSYIKVDGKWWIDMGGTLGPALKNIVDDILTIGYHMFEGRQIYGVYSNRTDSTGTYIVFTQKWGIETLPLICSIPKAGSKITVVYDNRRPISLFSGSCYVGLAPYNPVTTEDTYLKDTDTGRLNSVYEMPNPLCTNFLYSTFTISSRYKYLRGMIPNVDIMRSLFILFPSISQTNVPCLYAGFPTINYVERDITSYDPNPSALGGLGRYTDVSQNILTTFGSQYLDDFGTTMYRYTGGFIRPSYSLDYMRSLSGLFTSLPARGFQEVTYFPNRIAWTNRRQESVQDQPNNRTLLATSVYDLSDGFGENTYICAHNNILTVFTERNIARIPINKYTLSNVDGSAMGVIQANRFIGEVNWMDMGVGLPKERTSTVADAAGTLIFVDQNNDAYMLAQSLSPISLGFKWRLSTITKNDTDGIGLGFYRNDLGEVWLPVATGFIVYSIPTKSWFHVVFDTHTGFYSGGYPVMVGSGKINQCNGFTNMAGSPILHKANFVVQPAPAEFKEFVQMFLNGNNVNEIELIAKDYRSRIGTTADYSDVFKVRGNRRWAYIPSNETPPYNRCQADWVALSVKGYANTLESGNFVLQSLEVGANRIV